MKTKSSKHAERPTAKRFKSQLDAFEFKPQPAPKSTISIALPGSIIDTAKSPELKTYLVGQIARAISIYRVDEVIIFREHPRGVSTKEFIGVSDKKEAFDPDLFCVRLLQYLETPQYLRKTLFPMHRDLKFAGVLNALECPHHARPNEWLRYRDGVVLEHKNGQAKIDCGLQQEVTVKAPVLLDKGTRVTLEFPNDSSTKGVNIVSPRAPREIGGLYWGYKVRFAEGLSKVFTESPHEGGYDLTIGTSERGVEFSNVEKSISATKPKHSLIVFGGLHGIETCVDGDDQLTQVNSTNTKDLFDYWLNVCPYQGTRTIRAEEALLISLATLIPNLS